LKLKRSFFLRLCAVCVLLVGLACAAFVSVTATDESGEVFGYVVEGGQVYAVRPEDSRAYQRGLEYIGGKSAVFMTELREGFAALWQGDSLAIIIGFAAVAAFGLFLHAAERAEGRERTAAPPPGPSGRNPGV